MWAASPERISGKTSCAQTLCFKKAAFCQQCTRFSWFRTPVFIPPQKTYSNHTKGTQKCLKNSDPTLWRNPLKGDDTWNSIKAERNKGKAAGSEVGTNDTREITTVISLVNNCKHWPSTSTSIPNIKDTDEHLERSKVRGGDWEFRAQHKNGKGCGRT